MKPSQATLANSLRVYLLIKAGCVRPDFLAQMMSALREIRDHVEVCRRCRLAWDQAPSGEYPGPEDVCGWASLAMHRYGMMSREIVDHEGNLGPAVIP